MGHKWQRRGSDPISRVEGEVVVLALWASLSEVASLRVAAGDCVVDCRVVSGRKQKRKWVGLLTPARRKAQRIYQAPISLGLQVPWHGAIVFKVLANDKRNVIKSVTERFSLPTTPKAQATVSMLGANQTSGLRDVREAIKHHQSVLVGRLPFICASSRSLSFPGVYVETYNASRM